MTVNTRVIRILLAANSYPFVEIEDGLRVQVLPSISYLPRCQKHQFAAFIADVGLLVVWDDEPKKILSRVIGIETALMNMIWGATSAYPEENEKKEPAVDTQEYDPDLESFEEKPRRIVLMQAVLTAFTLALSLIALGAGWRNIAQEIAVDQNYIRVAFVAALIPQFWLSLVSSIHLLVRIKKSRC